MSGRAIMILFAAIVAGLVGYDLGRGPRATPLCDRDPLWWVWWIIGGLILVGHLAVFL